MLKEILTKKLLFLFLVLGTISLQAQEICNNSIDDNGNGLTDCDDPTCFNSPGFVCNCTPSSVIWLTSTLGIEWKNIATGAGATIGGVASGTDLAWAPNGNLYSISNVGIVTQRNPVNGSAGAVLTSLTGTFSPFNSLTFSSDSKMYYAGQGVNEIRVYDPSIPSTTIFCTWPPHVAPFSQGAAGDLAWSGGILYVTCLDFSVRGFDATGTLVSTTPSCSRSPFGLANDAQGNLYFARADSIFLFDKTTGSCNFLHKSSGSIRGATMWNEFCQVCPGTLSIGAFTPANPALCAGQTTTITSNPSGGIPPLTYRWSTGATTNSITVGTGNYTVTVTDLVNCSVTGTVNVALNPAPNIVVTPSGPTSFCLGRNVTLVASNANTYLWSTGATTNSIIVTALGASTFQVTGTSALGCTATLAAPVTVTVWGNPTANAGPDASRTGLQTHIIVGTVAAAGTPPYAYLWRTSPVVTGNNSTASNPTFGPFSAATALNVTVTDFNGCTATDLAVITHNSCPLVATLTNVTNVTCNGLSNGAIDISVTGNTGTITYLWSNGATTQDLTGRLAGSYTVTVSDQAGCTTTLNATITQPAVLQAGTCTDANDRCQLNQGQIRVNAIGGTAPYTVNLTPNHGTPANPASILTNGGSVTISGLHGGVNYGVVVTDANGCITP
jgi:SprB repeat